MTLFRNAASKCLRSLGFRPDRVSSEQAFFHAFFSGKHERAVSLYQAKEPSAWNIEEHHMAFASLVTLGWDYADVLDRIPPPLSPQEVFETLRSQICFEQNDGKRGLLIQPRYLHKSLFAAGIGVASRKSVFVETGTYTGQSVYKIVSLFREVHTVEASPDLNRAARELFKAKEITNVSALLGDSQGFLRSLAPQVYEDAVFFLDAHYSSGITSQEYGACPVIEEIDIVLSRSPNALIVVDDLRKMTGRDGYPTLEQILGSLPHTLLVQVAMDQLIIGPSGFAKLLKPILG